MNNDFVNDDIRDIILERDGYLEQLEDYKSRCEKAIGLIYDYQMNDEDNVNYKELLNILQNGSDENE